MKRTINILIIIVTLYSCDPIYVGEVRNNTNDDIVVEVYGKNLSYVNNDKSGNLIDTTVNCKKIKLGKGKVMPLVTSSGIAKPIIYEDLGFDSIVIKTTEGQIQASGNQIMNLFKIESRTNFIGIHTYDLYYISVGKEKYTE